MAYSHRMHRARLPRLQPTSTVKWARLASRSIYTNTDLEIVNDVSARMDRDTDRQEKYCAGAFRHVVTQWLTQTRLADIRTEFRFRGKHVTLVSFLHMAAYYGWSDIALTLVSAHGCDTNSKDDKGHTPVHYAAYAGHLEMVRHLTNPAQFDNPKNDDGVTVLHLACENGHLQIVQYLVSLKAQYDLSCGDDSGSTPLHYACTNGHRFIVRYLIDEAGCHPTCDSSGRTLLHIACFCGHSQIARYLIHEVHCHPSCQDDTGNTPLHYACLWNRLDIVQYLLSTRRVDPLAENKSGHSPVSFATGKYNIIKLLKPFIHSKRVYPIHTFTKLFLTGDSGAGKTTMAQHIVLIAASRSSSIPLVDCVGDVERFTAGIVSLHVESNLGNFVIYDFAGNPEYYSSHAAIMDQVMHKSATMFICMVDLSKSYESICGSLQYWLSFISNACSKVKRKSHVVIVGSHVDLVQSSEEMNEKRLLLNKIATAGLKHQEYAGYVAMDCRRTNTDASHKLIDILNNSQKAIIASNPHISIYCHVLYGFLCAKLNVIGCTLQDLILAITQENNPSLPSDSHDLTELLTLLSDKGLVVFIKHSKSRWIVLKTESLLNEINGTLFAPRHFKEYRVLASNTGIVLASTLHKVFPQHNSEMLLGFLESLDFCRSVDHSVLQYTNLQTTTPSHSTADLLFFPSLICSERPDGLIQQGTLQFGWCLGCMDEYQFFSSRFLHVLLLFVAHRFALAREYRPSASFSGLQRMCTVWRNGIYWRNDDNITTVVELLNSNQQLFVAMSYNKESRISFAKLRSSLLSLVFHIRQNHSRHTEVKEFLVSPSIVQQYPFYEVPDTALFSIYQVARSILLREATIPSYQDDRIYLETQSLHFEPYHSITPAYICRLFDLSMSGQKVEDSLLQEVGNFCHHLAVMPQVYSELREYLDSLSIYAGRNPLEVADLKMEDLLVVNLRDSPPSNLSIDDLFAVRAVLKNVIKWKDLGLALGLIFPTLQKIDSEKHGNVDDCMMEMLAAWLKQQDNVKQRGVPSWGVLQTALKHIGENQLADEITARTRLRSGRL